MDISNADYLKILKSTLSAKCDLPHQIAILEAAMAGHEIQYCLTNEEEWINIKNPQNHWYKFWTYKYRIKPSYKVIYQFLLKEVIAGKEHYHNSAYFYESIEDCQKHLAGYTVIRRLEHTRTEVSC